MNITWETIVLILGILGGITGLIAFANSQKKSVVDETRAGMKTDGAQDLKIEKIDTRLKSLEVEVKEFKQSQINLETRIFHAIDGLSNKLDGLISTLLKEKRNN